MNVVELTDRHVCACLGGEALSGEVKPSPTVTIDGIDLMSVDGVVWSDDASVGLRNCDGLVISFHDT